MSTQSLLGIVSDVHADVHALTDALGHLRRLGCERIVCAGDLVDYGLFPAETVELLRAAGIACARGNHDRWALSVRSHAGRIDGLSKPAMRWLAALPDCVRWETSGARLCMCHASPSHDMAEVLPGALTRAGVELLLEHASADVLIVGHTHIPFRISLDDGRCIVNPGATLRAPADPNDHDLATATFGVLNVAARTFSIRSVTTGDALPFLDRTLV